MPQDPTPAPAPGQPAASDLAGTLRTLEAQLPATVAPPRTAREIAGLNVRRDMLRQQLERAEEHRQQLAEQVRQASDIREGQAPPDPAVVATTRAGLEARLKEADARVLQLERDIAATDRALTQAGPEVLAQYEQQRPREPQHTGPDEGEVLGLMTGGFFLGMLTLTLGRRIRRWRRRGEAPSFGAPAGVGPDPRIDRLTQAVDAIAVEVERIGEGQRFVTQLMAERRGLAAADPERTLDATGAR